MNFAGSRLIFAKQLLIFDGDGTLWDSRRHAFKALHRALGDIDSSIFSLSFEDFVPLATLPIGHLFSVIAPDNRKAPIRELEARYWKYYLDEQHCRNNTVLYPGVAETLVEFKRKGFLLAITSSKPKEIVKSILKHFSLLFFDMLLATGDADIKPKPDPDIIHRITAYCRVDEEQVLYVGDRTADVMTGHNAGVNTAAAAYGYEKRQILLRSGPSVIIEKFSDLRRVVCRPQGYLPGSCVVNDS